MELMLRILVGLFALLFLAMGLNLMFNPAGATEGLSLIPVAEHGLNTLRGDMGGTFVGCGLLLVLGMLWRKADWLLAVAGLMALIAFGRVVGFVIDGNPGSATLIAFGFEVGMATVLAFAGRRLGQLA